MGDVFEQRFLGEMLNQKTKNLALLLASACELLRTSPLMCQMSGFMILCSKLRANAL